MTTVAQVAKRMQYVLRDRANRVARETGFIKRERVLSGSSFVTGLVSGWQAAPEVSLSGIGQAVGNAGTPITRQGIHARFTPEAVDFMKAMVKECLKVVVRSRAKPKKLLSRFNGVVLTDSSIVTLPNSLSEVWQGSGGFGEQASCAAVKISVRWNVQNGQLQVLELSDGIQHDRQSLAHQQAVEVGSLHIRDLGYFNLDDFDTIGKHGAFWLTRYKIGTHLLDEQGHVLDLKSWLPQQPAQRIDTRGFLGAKKQLPCRIIAERVPEHVVKQRHERLREIARQNQTTPSPRSLEMAHWTIYLTNASPEQLTCQAVFLIARYRWQIELLFRLWKSDLHIDTWRTKLPNRILCELYAKLVAAIITQWFMLIGCWHNPRRSFRQAMPAIHGLAWQWANSLHHLTFLKHTLYALQRALSKCYMEKSQCYPRHFQLLDDLYA
jgi:IS4 transposase